MKHAVKIMALFFALLVSGVFFMGCTDNSSASADTTVTVETTATQAGPLYSAGDIVKSASGSSGTGWLVISYDPATDAYTRAFIYQNSDGSWGYRMNDKTETSERNVMEKVYTVKVTRVSVSSIPTGMVTATPTFTSAAAYTTTSATTTVTTTTSAAKPQFKDIIPDDADAGTTVSITDLIGSNFQSGATVILAHTGSSNITATNVVWVSSSHLTCTFVLPSDATSGAWDIIITNPDGQYVNYSNYFTIHGSTSAAATTTTSTSGCTGVITQVDPIKQQISSIAGWTGPLTITASTGFQVGATVRLVQSGKVDITGTDCTLSSSLTSLTCPIVIPVGSQGTWDVTVTNTDGSCYFKSGAFTVNS